MKLFTILADSREKKPWQFQPYPVDVETVTLATGDYTIPEYAIYNGEQDTYYPERAVERKSATDFLNSIFQNRSRFRDEIRRAEGWEEPLRVLIESSRASFGNRYSGALQYRKVHPEQITGTIEAWEDQMNVSWDFYRSKEAAEEACFDMLFSWNRETDAL